MRGLSFFIFLIVAPMAQAQSPAATAPTAPTGQEQPKDHPKSSQEELAPTKPPPTKAQVFNDRPEVIASIDEDIFSLKDAIVAFLKTILMLLVVLAIAYILLGKGLPKLMNRTIQGNRMRIIERLPLDQKRSVFLVEVDDTTYLLGGSDQNLQLIDTLSGDNKDFQSKLELKKAANDALKEVS